MEHNPAISRASVLRYMLLPQILPRIGKLLGSGFNNLSYFMAVVFATLHIIPRNHPCLLPGQRQRYSLLKVMAVAANNLKPEWRSIDKIAVFVVILVGIVMMFLQLLLFFLAVLTKSAFAYAGPGLGPTTYADFFDNENPQTDIAFQILDYVFAVPGIFNGADAVAIEPFHVGLHALFEFYSFGMILVATIVIVYYVIAIALETAQSGVPFGQRFNKAWVPIRLILFFALLLPIGQYGINLGQYLVLQSARLGSNLATNAWILFDRTTSSAYLGEADQLLAEPNAPDFNDITTFMALARTCSWAEGRVNGRDIQPYIVYGAGAANSENVAEGIPAFNTIVNNTSGGNARFRFGVKDENLYGGEPGAVFPYCGEISLPIVDQGQAGSAFIQQAYMEMLMCLWSGESGAAFECYAYSFEDQGRDYTARYSMIRPYNHYPNMEPYIGETQKLQYLILMNMGFQETLDNAIEAQLADTDIMANPTVNRGWAGAGIWFNKIAEQNGALTTAVFTQPVIKKLPYVMEYVRGEKLKQDSNYPMEDIYSPTLSSGRTISFPTPQDRDVALILNQQFRYWGSTHAVSFFNNLPEAQNTAQTGNVIIDTMNLVMGTRGLFDMCKNTDVHPLAQLSSLGKGLVEHSIRGFGMAAGLGVASGIVSILDKQNFAQALKSATSFFLSFASIGLIIGFVLFYILPFVPFIYFFFAVMTWVKGIFEAMVGMPLWALAHLSIDSEGMPGDAAEAGYFYILEIFLRPLCILIGFLGGLIIFTAMVKVLHSIFYLVLANLSGHSLDAEPVTNCFLAPGQEAGAGAPTEGAYKRGVIDEFFYTIIYTIIVYMIGMACFKMVDLIPDNIMRWLGSGITSMGALDGDPAQGLVKNVTAGAALIGGKLQGNARSFGFFG